MGIVFSWWIPYFFGHPKKYAKELHETLGATWSFLPKIGDNPIPNAVHVVFHLLFVVNIIITCIIWYGQ